MIPLLALFGAGLIDGMTEAGRQSPLDTMNGRLALALGWSLLISLFVLAFQFHRWWGGRP